MTILLAMLRTPRVYDDQKINKLLLKVTCICWLIANIVGWRMFTTYRLFPTAPIFDSLDAVPQPVHTGLFCLSVLLLLLRLFINKRSILWSLLLVEICSIMLDQNRLQPWAYQYLFISFIFIANANNQKFIIVAATLVLASTYFYSGLGKLNEGFLQSTWTKMLLQTFLKVPPGMAMQSRVYYLGYLPGIIELLLGIGLLFAKTRRASAGLLILMHLFILVFLGPVGLRYNKIVWPWNVAMIAYLYLIFFGRAETALNFKPIFTGWNKLVFICWAILPAFNFVGYWDNYLSSNLYSGKPPRMFICVRDTSKCRPLQRFCKMNDKSVCNGEAIIDVTYWSLSETNIPPYPEIRAYKKIQKKLEKQYPDAGLSFVYWIDGTPGR